MKPPASLARYVDAARRVLNGPDEAIVKLGAVKALAAWIISLIPAPGPGVDVRRSLNGDVWSAAGAGGLGIHPFYIYPDGTLHAGTVGTTIPTLGGQPIGEDGPQISMSGDFYVYISAVFELTYGSHGFLDAAELDVVEIITTGSPQTESQGSSYLQTYRLIAQVIDGKVMREQPTTTSLNLSVCDNSTGASGGESAAATWTAT